MSGAIKKFLKAEENSRRDINKSFCARRNYVPPKNAESVTSCQVVASEIVQFLFLFS